MASDSEPTREELIDFKRHRIPVKFVHEDISEDKFLNACEECRQKTLGLTLIRLDLCKNLLVCLTTDRAIYVLDTRKPYQLELLKRMLTIDCGLRIYIVRGHVASYRFHSRFDFAINTEFVTDLTAFDAFISMRKAWLNGNIAKGQYTLTRFSEHVDPVRYRNRNDLMRWYLGIDLEKKDKEQETEERNLLIEDPKSDEAKKVIRERACLLDDLAITMEECSQAMYFQDGVNLYNFAHAIKGDNYTEYANHDDDSYKLVIDYLKRLGLADE